MIEGSLGSSLFCSPGYFRLQVLPDDPGDNTYGHTPLHIQTGDSKRYIVLFAGHPVVIAGVGYASPFLCLVRSNSTAESSSLSILWLRSMHLA